MVGFWLTDVSLPGLQKPGCRRFKSCAWDHNIKFKSASNRIESMSDDDWSNLDKVDQKIIAILNKNARTPSKEIATELRNSGLDVSDRTIRKRIERLEKNGIIKGYKAVLSDVSSSDKLEALFLKFKVTRSLDSITESIKDFVKSLPNYLFVATIDGEWNMLIVMKIEELQKNQSSKIIEKFSEQVLDYRISEIQLKDINLLNMSLLLLT